MKIILLCASLLLLYGCKNASRFQTSNSTATDINRSSTEDFTEFKVLDSEYIHNEELWKPFKNDLKDFSEEKYIALQPLILQQDIPTIQTYVSTGKLSYETLVKFYLFRIRKFDRENALSLNAVIALNPHIISEAKQKDLEIKNGQKKHSIFGMPILLKDNINASGMPTTAGAVAFQNNQPDDAFIVKRLKEHGALILGKANLSEWAYFFCGDCPSGYSAVGGQTLNPYGRRTLDTGGSSSGSGVAVAANFCVASIGTETSGSILSPSSHNAIVGLKPTVGLLSRRGIVPISSTLDTPGPMAKSAIDTAIVLDALRGHDQKDPKSMMGASEDMGYYENTLDQIPVNGKRFGAFKSLKVDSLYTKALADLTSKGAVIIEIEEEQLRLSNFTRLLTLDMKNDFYKYIESSDGADQQMTSIEDVIIFNRRDSLARMPYGQKLFEGILADSATELEFKAIKDSLKTNGRRFFDRPMQTHKLDGILSINNVHAGFAAVAEYPAITVPMGLTANGEPKGLTFIAPPLSELKLLGWANTYEQFSKRRVPPVNYQ